MHNELHKQLYDCNTLLTVLKSIICISDKFKYLYEL